MNMSIFDRINGDRYRAHRKRVTRRYRKGRLWRVQTIIRHENNRPVVKQIIHYAADCH